MSILYSYYNGTYLRMEALVSKEAELPVTSIYVNLTNQCPCACVFCIRNSRNRMKFNDLWLETEPSVEEVINEFKKLKLNKFREVIFCGYGEPLTRLEAVIAIARYLRTYDHLKIRVNTNGLGNLIHNADITSRLSGYIDCVSISLNASNEEEYLRLTNSIYGKGSFQALLEFACNCKKYVKEVRLTVVDVIGTDEIEKCRVLCAGYQLELMVRKYIQ